MIHPILAFGNQILRAETKEVEDCTPELQKLIAEMIETMQNASGVGLAAPQIGRSERMFVVDLSAVRDMQIEGIENIVPFEDRAHLAVINPEIEAIDGDKIEFEEGCLSIPDLREFVSRPDNISVRFKDENFESHEIEINGILSRVFQHEFDHLEGILFIDRISTLRKKLIKRRLRDIANGEVEAHYPLVTKLDLV